MADQNSQYMAILTAVGEAKQANANALGVPWLITEMGVGDANGAEPQPDRLQTALINERRRAPLNQLSVDPNNAAIIIAEQVIPENIGGWWIREIGLYDEDGDIVAVANCPPTFKPELSQGSGRTQVVRLNILVSSTQNIQLKIDPSVVLATRAYVDGLTVRASQHEAEAGEDNSKIMTPLRVFQAIRAAAIAPGAVWYFATDSAPTGWLKANGATVSRATYAALFAAIGTRHGAGDGATTFKLPDLRGEFIRGWDDGRGVDSGRGFGTSQGHAIEFHNHTLPTGSGNLDPTSGIWGVKDAYWEEITGPSLNTTPATNEVAITGSSGYQAYAATVVGNYANETRPRNIALLACIKY